MIEITLGLFPETGVSPEAMHQARAELREWLRWHSHPGRVITKDSARQSTVRTKSLNWREPRTSADALAIAR